MSIYHYEKRVQLALDLIKRSEEIIQQNKEKLVEYATYLKATGRSLPRRDKLLRTLKKLAELLGPTHFKEAGEKDMVNALAKVEGSDYTRRDFQEITKQFLAWLYGIKDPKHEGYPKAVSWMRPKTPKSKLKASDLLTPEEVKKLVNATTDLRMKALIVVCYECGLRIGEALKLKISDVHLEEQCASLTVSGKTGSRKAFSIVSLPKLMQWLDAHPDRENPEAWLWTDATQPLTYDRARFKLQQCRRKAKIHKRVYWHLFRHSSATLNADLGEPMLRKIYGWSKSSDEPGNYVHLSGEAVKNALLEKYGLNKKAEERRVIMCPRCNTPNQPNASLCARCKSVLNLEDVLSIGDIRSKLEEQSELVEKLKTQVEMMQEGIMERDKQYFKLKYPQTFKNMTKRERSIDLGA